MFTLQNFAEIFKEIHLELIIFSSKMCSWFRTVVVLSVNPHGDPSISQFHATYVY